jgi:hypothetical protein
MIKQLSSFELWQNTLTGIIDQAILFMIIIYFVGYDHIDFAPSDRI